MRACTVTSAVSNDKDVLELHFAGSSRLFNFSCKCDIFLLNSSFCCCLDVCPLYSLLTSCLRFCSFIFCWTGKSTHSLSSCSELNTISFSSVILSYWCLSVAWARLELVSSLDILHLIFVTKTWGLLLDLNMRIKGKTCSYISCSTGIMHEWVFMNQSRCCMLAKHTGWSLPVTV